MLLEASDPEIFAVKVEVYFYFETEEVLHYYSIVAINGYPVPYSSLKGDSRFKPS